MLLDRFDCRLDALDTAHIRALREHASALHAHLVASAEQHTPLPPPPASLSASFAGREAGGFDGFTPPAHGIAERCASNEDAWAALYELPDVGGASPPQEPWAGYYLG